MTLPVRRLRGTEVLDRGRRPARAPCAGRSGMAHAAFAQAGSGAVIRGRRWGALAVVPSPSTSRAKGACRSAKAIHAIAQTNHPGRLEILQRGIGAPPRQLGDMGQFPPLGHDQAAVHPGELLSTRARQAATRRTGFERTPSTSTASIGKVAPPMFLRGS